jgi:hypothetical protein
MMDRTKDRLTFHDQESLLDEVITIMGRSHRLCNPVTSAGIRGRTIAPISAVLSKRFRRIDRWRHLKTTGTSNQDVSFNKHGGQFPEASNVPQFEHLLFSAGAP